MRYKVRIDEVRVDERRLDLGIVSPSVDTTVRWVRLLLPPGWSEDAYRTWPTLWMLHGGGVDAGHEDWDKRSLAELTQAKDVIVVLPQTNSCSAYSDWLTGWDGRPAPKWETFLTAEVPRILELQYRANGDRVVAGNSMGGLGALKFAANHPGMFRAAASFSGNVDPLHSSGSLPRFDWPGQGCSSNPAFWKTVWGDPRTADGLPVWQRNNPYDLAAKLAGTPLYISCGDGLPGQPREDWIEKHMYQENLPLVARLDELGIPVTRHFYPGTHSWEYWEREIKAALPMLLSAVGVA